MQELINLDIRILIGILVWINLVLSILLSTFHSYVKKQSEKRILSVFIGAKIFQCAAWLLMFYRGTLTIFITRYVGNAFLFVGFALESIVLIYISGKMNNHNIYFQLILSIIGIVIFSMMPSTLDNSTFVIVGTVITVAIYLYPTGLNLYNEKNTAYKRLLSLLYMIFIIFMLLRIYEALVSNISLLTSTYIQNGTFITILVIAVTSAPVFLLQLKENADQELIEYATLDSLTKTLNRRTFNEKADILLKYHERNMQSISVLFVDIDYFKVVNDTFGHDFGDEVLIELADILKLSCRESDLVTRYGGEEFVVILSNTNSEGAIKVIDRINTYIKETTLSSDDFKYTISVGIYSIVPDGSSINEYIIKSDKAMYEAKKRGRNQYVDYNEFTQK